MIFKRSILFGILFVLILGLTFAGGQQDRRPTRSADGRPILQIGMQQNAFIVDFKDNDLTRYMERMHNVYLDFYLMPAQAKKRGFERTCDGHFRFLYLPSMIPCPIKHYFHSNVFHILDFPVVFIFSLFYLNCTQ